MNKNFAMMVLPDGFAYSAEACPPPSVTTTNELRPFGHRGGKKKNRRAPYGSFRPKERSDLDHAAGGQRRNAERQGNRLIAILAFDQVVTAALLFGFRERSIHDCRFAVLDTDSGGLGTRVELGAAAQAAALFQLLDPGAIFGHDAVPLEFRQRRPFGLVETAQQ